MQNIYFLLILHLAGETRKHEQIFILNNIETESTRVLYDQYCTLLDQCVSIYGVQNLMFEFMVPSR